MAVQDPLDGVSTFVQVVEAGGFTSAAERIGVTRSAVGKAVARLETRLGTRLLQRNTRSQTLTEEGQIYYERCIRALKELEAAEADLDSGRMEPSGRLRVSAPEGFGQLCVTPILLNLTRLYPQLSIDLSFSDRTVDLIEEGFDLAIRIGPLHDSGTLSARLLGIQHISIGCTCPVECFASNWAERSPRPSLAGAFSDQHGRHPGHCRCCCSGLWHCLGTLLAVEQLCQTW